MGKSIRDEKLKDARTLFLLYEEKYKYTDTSGFVIGVDAGAIQNRGSIEISLEGILLKFEKWEIVTRYSEEERVNYSSHEFNTLKRPYYLEIDESDRKCKGKDEPFINSQVSEVAMYAFNKERAEIVSLIEKILSGIFADCSSGEFLNEQELAHRIEDWKELHFEKEFNVFLKEISYIYNSYINDKNREMDREDRAEEILSNSEFRKQLQNLCVKFLLKFEMKKISSMNAVNSVFEKQFTEFENVLKEMERFIELREDYQFFDNSLVPKKEKRRAEEHLDNIKLTFNKINKEYEELIKCREKNLKGTYDFNNYEKILKNFEKDTLNCLKSLEALEMGYGFRNPLYYLEKNNKFDSKMGKYTSSKVNLDNLSFEEHSRLEYDLQVAVKEFKTFISQYDGVSSNLSKAQIAKAEEKCSPYIEKLKKDELFYIERLNHQRIKYIELLECKKAESSFGLNEFINILNSSIDILQTRESLFTTFYLKGTSYKDCTAEELKNHEKISDCLASLTNLMLDIEKRLKKETSEKVQELLDCSDSGFKVSLYDKYMVEKYKYEVGSVENDDEKVNVFEKALKKNLSGEGFLTNLLNSISAFDDIDSLYMGYLGYTMKKEMTEKLIATLESVSDSMGDTSSKDESKKSNAEMLNDMIKELEEKGLSKEEAIVFLGKLAEKVAEPGYYSDEDTEDTENSRFSAMNKR